MVASMCTHGNVRRRHFFNNLRLYKRRGWMAKGKKPMRHHDIWEEVYQSLEFRTAPLLMTHVYGHNKNVYNDAADALARAGAAKSKVHRTVRPKVAPGDGLRVRRQKQTRSRGVKGQASLQVSEDDKDSDRPIIICHKRRRMRNVPLEIADPEPD